MELLQSMVLSAKEDEAHPVHFWCVDVIPVSKKVGRPIFIENLLTALSPHLQERTVFGACFKVAFERRLRWSKIIGLEMSVHPRTAVWRFYRCGGTYFECFETLC